MVGADKRRARWLPGRRREGAHSILLLCVLGLALMLTPVLTACRASTAESSSGVQIGLNVAGEKVVGPAVVEVTLKSAAGSPIDGAQLSLRGDMSHAGMKPVIVQMKSASNGGYRADDFRFTMAGDWVLTVEAVLPGGEKVQRTFDVPGVRGG